MQSDTVRQHPIVKAISEKAHAIVPPGSEIILFGSRARGDARPDSDWDVLIVLNKDGRVTGDDIDNYSYPLREMGWDFDQDINTILYTRNQWKKESFTPFYKNVEEDGIRL